MGSETENKYFLKAVEAFKRRLIVISPDFKILAANDRRGRRIQRLIGQSLSPGFL